jgi:hypothetical protein
MQKRLGNGTYQLRLEDIQIPEHSVKFYKESVSLWLLTQNDGFKILKMWLQDRDDKYKNFAIYKIKKYTNVDVLEQTDLLDEELFCLLFSELMETKNIVVKVCSSIIV